MKQKIIFFVLGLLAGSIIGASIIAIVKQPSSSSNNSTTAFEGSIICLPHKNTSGPQTLECATGFKTTDVKTYALPSSQPLTTLSGLAGSDKKVRINGTIQATDASSIYQTDGTLSVTDYQILP